MLRTLVLFAASLMISLSATAQFGYDKSKDKENGMTVYKGDFTFDELKKEPEFSWLEKGATSYKPDTSATRFLKKHLGKFNLVILMGTWCDDSHNLVPKLYKVMQETGYPMKQYQMYGLDRAKEAKGIEHKLYQVNKVPTIIVFKDQNEVGRITETVQKNIETDLMKIIEPVVVAEEKAKMSK